MKEFRLIKPPYDTNVTEFRQDEVQDVPKFDITVGGHTICCRTGGDFGHKAIFVSNRLKPHIGRDSDGYHIIVFTREPAT